MISFLKPEEQHQHKNGGGWVANTAMVGENAYVGSNAQVFGDAWVSGNAWVFGDAWETSPFYIQGTKHAVTNSAYGKLTIGCITLTFAEWKKQAKKLGKENGYTAAQVKEYGLIIELATKLGK